MNGEKLSNTPVIVITIIIIHLIIVVLVILFNRHCVILVVLAVTDTGYGTGVCNIRYNWHTLCEMDWNGFYLPFTYFHLRQPLPTLQALSNSKPSPRTASHAVCHPDCVHSTVNAVLSRFNVINSHLMCTY